MRRCSRCVTSSATPTSARRTITSQATPFERYVYDSYYAAVFEEGETDEYCLQTKGRDRRITGAVVGGSHSWVIMGHAYWTRDFTCDFMRFLSQEYHLTETVGKLWDDIFLEHADELRMYMRPYEKGEIREFDSLPAAGFRPAVHRERGLERARQHLRDAQLPARRHLERKAYQEGLTNLSSTSNAAARRSCTDIRAGTDETASTAS